MTKYRVGWCRDGKWHYITVNSKADMIAEVADKTVLSKKVSIRVIEAVKL